MTWLLLLAVVAMFLVSGGTGYSLARAELAERLAPRDPRTRGMRRVANFSTSVSLVALAAVLLMVLFL